MKNSIFSLFIVLFLASCQEKKTETIDVKLLNGYWEIENVSLADGTLKEYKMNETIDFITVKNDSGFRKKVKPQFDGTYLINDVDEKFTIVKSPKGTYIHYKTDYDEWKEKVESVTKEQLILVNDQQLKYQYKRPIPFTIK